jgi:hypothetical protein
LDVMYVAERDEVGWIRRLDDVGGRDELLTTVDEWWAWTKASGYPQGSLGFEYYMLVKDWAAAKGSVIRSFGRGLGPHQHLLEFLTNAIECKRRLPQ